MKVSKLRQAFLDFFQSRGHTVHPSDSLVPSNDPSLLFTSAGMNQFKDMFLGSSRLPFKRATTSQKCMRTGDIENVGKTASHHTFFEMLGNFSFGDYFKAEAIKYAWEFLTQELGIREKKLWASVYRKDDEAAELWKKILPAERIVRFGEHDNFWPADAPKLGPNGPCGPCSEIFFDFVDVQPGCGKADCSPECDCGRFVEIWNLVFMQFERQEGGELVPLKQKNIDTGMGLERLAAVMQGVWSNFDIDIFAPSISQLGPLLGLPQSEWKGKSEFSHDAEGSARSKLNRIVDHARAVIFCISDGILPSNERQGYVVRHLLRSAVRDGWLLGRREPFIHLLVSAIASEMESAYPNLDVPRIEQHIHGEEGRFLETIESGMERLKEEVARLKKEGKKELDGKAAFKLYDTYGFPLEITKSLLPKGYDVDTGAFVGELELQKERSRKASLFQGDVFQKGALQELKERFKPTAYIGEKKLKAKVTVQAVVRDDVVTEIAEEGDEILVLTDQTPFYGESGGQIGDTGHIKARNLLVEVSDTQRPDGYFLHKGRIVTGRLRAGEKVEAVVNAERRADIIRNHDATHLLQAALRQVLGSHVEQKGSIVHPDYLRFDFSHPQAMTDKEQDEVEALVNRKILEDLKIFKKEMSMAEARKAGAIMFFGEKYGDVVRAVRTADNFTVELCGGSHGDHTSPIGSFRIVSESSIGSGTRRIVGVTGSKAVEAMTADRAAVLQASQALGGTPADLLSKIEALQKQVKELKKGGGAKAVSQDAVGEMLKSARQVGDEKIVAHAFRNDLKPDQVRSLLDVLIKKHRVAAAVVTGKAGGKPFGIVSVRPDFTSKVKAGDVAKELGKICGGSGGGRPHMAQFGIADASKIAEAFKTFENRLAGA